LLALGQGIRTILEPGIHTMMEGIHSMGEPGIHTMGTVFAKKYKQYFSKTK
jgi:hypothetical protein